MRYKLQLFSVGSQRAGSVAAAEFDALACPTSWFVSVSPGGHLVFCSKRDRRFRIRALYFSLSDVTVRGILQTKRVSGSVLTKHKAH